MPTASATPGAPTSGGRRRSVGENYGGGAAAGNDIAADGRIERDYTFVVA